MGKKKTDAALGVTMTKVKNEKSGDLLRKKKVPIETKSKKKQHRKKEKVGRGRKPYFSAEEIRILRDIVEKRRRLDQRLTRPIIAKQFKKKTGRKITHIQRLSDIRGKLGLSWQKLQPRSRRQAAQATKERVAVFLKRERRNARRRQWFVDQIKLPDAEVIGRGYGSPGKGAFVAVGPSSGTGTGIMSCNWEHGMGPFSYVRNTSGGTTRDDMKKYFRKLRKVMQPGDILYMDNAQINQDNQFHTIEAYFGRKQVFVRYLPPNSTHLCSPLDQQPFAELRQLWVTKKHSDTKSAKAALRRCVSGISAAVVRKGIKTAGF